MEDSYASVTLGGEDRNAEYLGIFVAWLVANDLLAEPLKRRAAKAVSRLRLQDLTGSAFLTTVLEGELRPDQLSEAGRDFAERYLVSGTYRRDFDAIAFDGDDEWAHYDVVAPLITAAWRGEPQPEKSPKTAKILKFPGRSG